MLMHGVSAQFVPINFYVPGYLVWFILGDSSNDLWHLGIFCILNGRFIPNMLFLFLIFHIMLLIFTPKDFGIVIGLK